MTKSFKMWGKVGKSLQLPYVNEEKLMRMGGGLRSYKRPFKAWHFKWSLTGGSTVLLLNMPNICS